jgi:hypothetical protein
MPGRMHEFDCEAFGRRQILPATYIATVALFIHHHAVSKLCDSIRDHQLDYQR